jgi:DNA-binding transcriptional MocR family regulator
MKTLIFENEELNQGFTQIPNYILYDTEISPSARFLLSLLLSFAWTTDQVFPGKEKLGKLMNCSEDTVHKYLLELKDKNLISWKRRGLGKTNVYKIKSWRFHQIRTLNSRVQEPENLGIKNPSEIGTNNTKINNTKIEKGEHPIVNQNISETGLSEYQRLRKIRTTKKTKKTSFNSGFPSYNSAPTEHKTYSTEILITENQMKEFEQQYPMLYVDQELEKARDYLKGEGRGKADPVAWFRNWLRRSEDQRPKDQIKYRRIN